MQLGILAHKIVLLGNLIRVRVGFGDSYYSLVVFIK